MGSYGAATIVFWGYSASIPINIGEYQQPEDEARKYREEEEEALGRIRAAAPELQRIYEHYAAGRHPYARHRNLLDRDRTESRPHDHGGQFTLHGTLDGIQVQVFVKPEGTEALRDKVVADVQLSQLAGGPLASHFERARTLPMPDRPLDIVLGELLEHCSSPGHPEVVSTLLELAFARPKALRSLAEAGAPAPRLAALALASTVDRTAIPTVAFDLLRELQKPDLKVAAVMTLLRFLADAQWEEGTARLRTLLDTPDTPGWASRLLG